jgi:catechol 2,3-dioxygenase-like lactoylglutathione lyase family enzyme
MAILGIHHVQIAVTPGGEEEARRFYGTLLGMAEAPKPEALAGRGGVWFQCGEQQLHCGVESPVAGSRRHPALLTDELDRLSARLQKAGCPIQHEPELPGFRRFFSEDPFGNRVELLQRL